MANLRESSAAKLNDLAALCVRRPYLATVLNLLIVVAGLSAMLGVEVRELPDIDRPVVTVRATYPGASPETLDGEVTGIVEAAVARVNGIKEVRSSSEENSFRIRAVFQPNVDLITAANDVREAVARVERELPDEVEDIIVIKADADAEPIVKFAVSSDTLRIEDITQLAENDIIPALTSVAGVAEVTISGARERVMRVVIDPTRLARFGLAVSDVTAVLANARFDVPTGSFASRDQEIIVRADASVASPAAIEDIIVRDPVRLGEVASAYFGPADPENYTRVDNRSVITLGIVRRAQSNTVAISNAVDEVAVKLRTRFKDLKIEKITDDAVFIRGAIYEVLVSLLISIGIVVAIIAAFTGNIRVSLIPAVAIPVALVGTVAAIWLMGFSVNLITLLALVLATGLVVDDAIVVLENIQRKRAEGKPPAAAAVLGTRQVFFAVIATTATLVSVFVPISFLPSSAGRLFAEFGFVLAVAVMISSFVALTLCPMLASRLPASSDTPTPASQMLARIGAPLQRAYGRVIDVILAVPLIVLGASIAIGAVGVVVHQSLGEELVPQEDRGKLIIRLTGPDGTGIDYIDRQAEAVEKVLAPFVADGTVERISTISGRGDPNRGWIEAPLQDWSTRTMSEGALAAELNKRLRDIPGAQVRIVRGNSLNLRDAGGGLKFALTGPNYEQIFAAANDMVARMERDLPQLENFRVEFRATQPQIALKIDRRRASDIGVPIANLASTVEALVDQREISELTVDDQIVPIIVQARNGAIDDPSDLNNLFVATSDGRMIALSQLVTFSEKAVAAELDRHGQRRAIEISADPVGETSLREAVTAVQKLADATLPRGIGLLLLDEAAALDETSDELSTTYVIAILIVFLVLVAQFESITSALVVLITVPFGVCAAVFALGLSGTSINIYSQIGVLMLIGIMAKNAILMVEFADQLREDGRSALEAAREASLVRLRPIAMTMISTVLAGLPLVFGDGPGTESRAAIGWVVVGGLGMASAFTLFLTPALYALIAPFSKPRLEQTQKLERELAAS